MNSSIQHLETYYFIGYLFRNLSRMHSYPSRQDFVEGLVMVDWYKRSRSGYHYWRFSLVPWSWDHVHFYKGSVWANILTASGSFSYDDSFNLPRWGCITNLRILNLSRVPLPYQSLSAVGRELVVYKRVLEDLILIAYQLFQIVPRRYVTFRACECNCWIIRLVVI